MAKKKQDLGSSRKKNGPDSLEIFENLFKQELQELGAKEGGSEAAPAGPKPAPPKEPESPLQKTVKKAQSPPRRPSTQSLPKRAAPVGQQKAARTAPGEATPTKRQARSSTGSLRRRSVPARKKILDAGTGPAGEVRARAAEKGAPPLRKVSRGEVYIPNKTPKAKNLGLLKVALPVLVLLILAGLLIRQYDFLGLQDFDERSGTVKKKILVRPLPTRPPSQTTVPAQRPRPSPSDTGRKTEAPAPPVTSSGPAMGPTQVAQKVGTPSPQGAATRQPSGPELEEEDDVAPGQKKVPPETGQPPPRPAPKPSGTVPSKAVVTAEKASKKKAEELESRAMPSPPTSISTASWTALFPFSVYLGSYKTLSGIRKAARDYSERGVSTYWAEVDLGDKGVWFRLFTGAFRTRGEADAFVRKRALKDGASKRTRYALLLGIDKSPKGLEAKRQSLAKAGLSPYIIKDPSGDFGLFLGAFYQKKRALKTISTLAKKGVAAKVVLR